MSESNYQENANGLYVPCGTGQPISADAAGSLMKIQKLKERTDSANRSMVNFQSIMFWINGITTALYAIIISYRWYSATFGPPAGFNQWAMAGLVMALSAGILLSVLDVARYFWAEGKIASHSTHGQRSLAKFLAGYNFLGSLVASTVATRFLISMMGATTLTGVETSIGTFTTIVTVSLIVNLIGMYAYAEMSPTTNQLSVVAQKSSDHEEAILSAFKTALAGSENDVSARFLENGDHVRNVLVSGDSGIRAQSEPAQASNPNQFHIFDREPVLHGVNGGTGNDQNGSKNG